MWIEKQASGKRAVCALIMKKAAHTADSVCTETNLSASRWSHTGPLLHAPLLHAPMRVRFSMVDTDGLGCTHSPEWQFFPKIGRVSVTILRAKPTLVHSTAAMSRHILVNCLQYYSACTCLPLGFAIGCDLSNCLRLFQDFKKFGHSSLGLECAFLMCDQRGMVPTQLH